MTKCSMPGPVMSHSLVRHSVTWPFSPVVMCPGDNCDKELPEFTQNRHLLGLQSQQKALDTPATRVRKWYCSSWGVFSLVVRCQVSLGRSSTPDSSVICSLEILPLNPILWCWCSPSSLVATASFSGGPPPQFTPTLSNLTNCYKRDICNNLRSYTNIARLKILNTCRGGGAIDGQRGSGLVLVQLLWRGTDSRKKSWFF